MGAASLVIVMLVVAIGILHGAPSSFNFDGIKRNSEVGALSMVVSGFMLTRHEWSIQEGTLLPVDNWSDSLRNSGFLPPPRVANYRYAYDEVSGVGYYFCIYSEREDMPMTYALDVKQRLQDRIGEDAYISENCGATSEEVIDLTTVDSVSITIFSGS